MSKAQPLLSRPFRRFTLPRAFAELDTALAKLPDPRFLLQIDQRANHSEPGELLGAARDHLLIWNAFWRKLLRLRLCADDGRQPRPFKAFIGSGRKKMRKRDFSDRGDHLLLVRSAFAYACAQFGHRLLCKSVRCETPEQALAAVRLRLFGLELTRRHRNLFGIKSQTGEGPTHVSPLPECHVARLMLPFLFSERHGLGDWAPRKVRGAHAAVMMRIVACADLTRRPLSDGAKKSLIHLVIRLYRIQRDGPRPALDRRDVRIRDIPRLLSVFEEILTAQFGASPPSVIDVVPSEEELLSLLSRRNPTLEITNRRIQVLASPRPAAAPRPKRDPFSIIRPDRPAGSATDSMAAKSAERRTPDSIVCMPGSTTPAMPVQPIIDSIEITAVRPATSEPVPYGVLAERAGVPKTTMAPWLNRNRHKLPKSAWRWNRDRTEHLYFEHAVLPIFEARRKRKRK
jgi:hypothetical protein